METGTKKRWGIVAVAVAMFIVTMVNTSLNGQKTSLYYWVWVMVGWYGYRGNLNDIRGLLKFLIILNLVILLGFSIYLGWDIEAITPVAIGAAIMLVPKIILYYYCDSKLREGDETKVVFNTIEGQKDEIWERALNEYESAQRDRALYAKLLAEHDGNENLIKANYIKLKVQAWRIKEKNIEIKVKKPPTNMFGEYDFEVQQVNAPYNKLDGTAFQKLLHKLGAPDWFESALIIILAGGVFYLLFNMLSLFR